MRNGRWLNLRAVPRCLKSILMAAFAAMLLSTPALAQTTSLEELISAVVKIKTHINPDGRTVPASIVGYDHETGFGLLRTIEPLKIKPLTFGRATDVKEKDVAVVASGGGASMVVPVQVVGKREFVGNWEY